jgi:hypothetical protein
MLKRQEREVGRNRHWRSNFKQLQRQLIQLEEDEVVLDSVFPQVRLLSGGPAAAADLPQTNGRHKRLLHTVARYISQRKAPLCVDVCTQDMLFGCLMFSCCRVRMVRCAG